MQPLLQRFKRTDSERKAFVYKRLRAGHMLNVAQSFRLRGEDGRRLVASSVAARYDFIHDEEMHRHDKITPNNVKYWKNKARDPTLHPGSHGGLRWEKLAGDGYDGCKPFVCAALWHQINTYPASQLNILTVVANEAISVFAADRGVVAVVVSQRWVARVFQKWGWSWKVPTVVQLHKFTEDNLTRYVNYLVFAAGIPLHRCKFCDEIHFISRGDLFLFNSAVIS
jgi:hypothetical protein